METMQILWSDLRNRVRRFVGARVNDAHAADDITQDVMLKVQTQLDALPPEDKLAAWVFQVARNAIVDYYRARGVREHAQLDDAHAADDESQRASAIAELTPCLSRMIALLPTEYRAALTMADLEGASQQAIADRAGISLSGAKSRVQRARTMLREMIADCCRIERDARGGVVDFETTERSPRYCDPGDSGGSCG